MKKIKFLTLSGIISGMVFVSKTAPDASICDVELKNIEALANNEINFDDKSTCYKTGSIECIDGGYSEYSMIYRLNRSTSPN